MELPCTREHHFHPSGRPQNEPKRKSIFERAPGPPFLVSRRPETKTSAEHVPQEPPQRGATFARKSFKMAPLRSVAPSLSHKGSREPPGVDFGSILGRKMTDIRQEILQSIDIHSKPLKKCERYEKAPAGMLLLRDAIFETQKSPCGHVTAQKCYF